MTNIDQYLLDTYQLVTGAQAPVLRQKAREVTFIDKDMRVLARDLVELMRLYDGVGLAAPQIGKSVRMFAYTQRDTTKKKRDLLEEGVMINPKIVATHGELVTEAEACLSLPGLEGDVERVSGITITYQDIRGKQQIKKATGYNARILMHELDHLNGVLFIDTAKDVREVKKK